MGENRLQLAKRDRFFEETKKYHTGRTKEFDADSMAVWFGMIQTFLAMESRVSLRAQAHGLTLPAMNVIAILCRHEPEGIPLNELSQYLTVSRANITGLMDNLVRKALVRRVDHPTDRRVCLARVTPKGKSWLNTFLPGHFKSIKQILSPLTKQEKGLLVKLLLKVRKNILIAVSLIVAVRFAQAAERTLSLSDAMTLALQNNLSIKLAQAQTEEARAHVRQTAAGLLPNLLGTAYQSRVFKTNLAAEGFPSGSGLPFNVLIGPYDVFDARLQLTQKIFDLGLYRQTRSARALAEVSQWQEKLAGDQVMSAAALAYIEAQRSASVVAAAQSDADLANTLLKQTQDQHRAGTATGVDEARAQTRLAQEQVRLIHAHVDARQAALRLARVTVLPLEDSLKLTDALATVPLDTATLAVNIPFAWEHRFELRVAQAEQRADDEALGSARAEFLPTIKAAADYGFSGNLPQGSARTGSIRGQLDLPIFSGGATLAEIRETKARRTAAEANVIDTRNQVEEDVDISHDTLTAAVDELHATDLEVQLATRELQMARDRFSAGVGDNIQLLSAQTALESARENQINALAGYHVARVNWALALGTVSAFHL